MEPDDLKTRFTPKWLDKRIPGQRLFPTRELRPFEYGAFEEVYPMKFESIPFLAGSRERYCRLLGKDCLGLSQSVLSRIFTKS